MTLTAPPTAPTTSDPTTFNSRADSLVAWFSTHVTEENALITALAGSYTGASATSLTPSVASKSFTASTGLAYQVGQPVMMASASVPGVWMSGTVTAYVSATGAMTVNVTSIGTATAKADWIISLVPAGYTPGQIAGTATNDSATAGNIGERISSTVLVASAVSLTNGITANITSISLTAGDWDVWGSAFFHFGVGATGSSPGGAISTTSATFPVAPANGGSVFFGSLSMSNSSDTGFSVGFTTLGLASPTTVYLICSSTFSGGTGVAYGYIGARRRR